MDFELPGADDERRIAVREWIEATPNVTSRQLAEAGYVAPHWPRPWGLEADAIGQIIIDDELTKAGIRRPMNPIGIGWAGPTLLYAGSKEQQDRYLFPILSGEEFWCQLFSEPGAGSDLAGLGTTAIRDGDEFVVNGQKIWTSGAQFATFGILIARTDPAVPKHRGISYFVCPMDLPGIEIRPIVEMTGGSTFNEVFFTDVRLPAESLVGDLNDGWRLAKVTLGNERVSLSTGGVLWGSGPTALEFLDSVRARGPVADATARHRRTTRTVVVRRQTDHPAMTEFARKGLHASVSGVLCPQRATGDCPRERTCPVRARKRRFGRREPFEGISSRSG